MTHPRHTAEVADPYAVAKAAEALRYTIDIDYNQDLGPAGIVDRRLAELKAAVAEAELPASFLLDRGAMGMVLVSFDEDGALPLMEDVRDDELERLPEAIPLYEGRLW